MASRRLTLCLVALFALASCEDAPTTPSAEVEDAASDVNAGTPSQAPSTGAWGGPSEPDTSTSDPGTPRSAEDTTVEPEVYVPLPGEVGAT